MAIPVLNARLLLALGTATLAFPVAAGDWDWTLAPYGWAASIRSDVETSRPQFEGSSEVKFADILDKLDGTLQLHLEGRGDKVGMFADFTYLGISDSHQGSFARTESDLDTRLLEAAMVWTPGGQRDRGLDLFGGIRFIDADFKIRVDPVNEQFPGRVLDAGDSYLDAMFGARYTWAPAERWRITARGDVSTGQTEGSWNASLTAHYRTARGGFLFGYRHLDVELETSGIRTDLRMSGPMVGYGFSF